MRSNSNAIIRLQGRLATKKQTECIFKTQHVNNIGGWRGTFKVRATPKPKGPNTFPKHCIIEFPWIHLWYSYFPVETDPTARSARYCNSLEKIVTPQTGNRHHVHHVLGMVRSFSLTVFFSRSSVPQNQQDQWPMTPMTPMTPRSKIAISFWGLFGVPPQLVHGLYPPKGPAKLHSASDAGCINISSVSTATSIVH